MFEKLLAWFNRPKVHGAVAAALLYGATMVPPQYQPLMQAAGTLFAGMGVSTPHAPPAAQ